MNRFKIITFGCQMNEDDSNRVALFLKDKGLLETDDINEADLLVVNTCTVRQHAEDRALSLIGRLKRWKKDESRKLVVIGCAAERAKEIIQRKFKYVDFVIGAKSFNSVFDVLKDIVGERDEYSKDFPSDISEYVTISRGCSMNCSYCVVPFVRGKTVYFSFDDVVDEVRRKAKNGAREIILLGQTVNAYKYGGYDFVDLIGKISEIDEVKIIRFMSPHPIFFSDKFFKEYEINEKISRWIHLPLQSASDRVLASMKRGYTYARFKEIVNIFKQIDPSTSITSDIIVGFSGESEEDFEKTLLALEELRFSMVYCFKYSPRFKGSFPLTISQDELERRHQKVLNIAKRIAKRVTSERTGRIETVLVIDENGNGKTLSGYNCCIIDNTRRKGEVFKAIVDDVKNNVLYVRSIGNDT